LLGAAGLRLFPLSEEFIGPSDHQEPPDGSRFLRSFIRERERAYRYGLRPGWRERSPDFLVLCASKPIPGGPAARLGLLERVVRHQVRIFDRVLRVGVYRCPPGFDPEVLKRPGSMSGEA